MYIDPSSGGMLFQILAISFGVISGGVLLFSSRIKLGFAKLKRRLRKSEEQENETPSDDS